MVAPQPFECLKVIVWPPLMQVHKMMPPMNTCLKNHYKRMIVTYSIWLYPECEIVEAFKDRQPGSSSHLDELISLFSNVNT